MAVAELVADRTSRRTLSPQGSAHGVWAIQPWKRIAYYASPSGFQKPLEGVLRIEGAPIAISLPAVCAELDEF